MTKMGRKPKILNEEQLNTLAAINCSMDEIAAVMKVDRRTLQRRYAAVIEKGRANGRMSLKRKMWELAMNGNITMCIWLSKQLLGYTDKVENNDTISANVTTEKTLIILPENGRESKDPKTT